MARMLDRESVVKALRGWGSWSRLGVRWAILFGGLARRGRGGDVDILVDDGSVMELVLAVSEALNIDPDRVDVVAGRDAPCTILMDAWGNGVVLYESRRGEAREWLLVRVNVCNDYKIMARKLGVVDVAVRAARRRWGP